jgi:hypothetical protein
MYKNEMEIRYSNYNLKTNFGGISWVSGNMDWGASAS